MTARLPPMPGLQRLEGLLQRWIRRAAESGGFLSLCCLLAAVSAVTGSFPATAVVVPATLLVPRHWRRIVAVCAFGSACGATLLAAMFHHLGWHQVYARFPEMNTHPAWQETVRWVSDYGAWALLGIAATPLPQTPALAFFAIARQDYQDLFLAILAGKALKYGVLAWLVSRFPERFGGATR